MKHNQVPSADRIRLGITALGLCCTLANLHGAAASLKPADESAPQSLRTFSPLLGDYRTYYAEIEPLCFTRIAPGPASAYGVHLAFDSNLQGFARVEYDGDGEGFRPLPEKSVFIPFNGKGDKVQEKTFRVRPVLASGESPQVYTIRINCTTRRAFEQSGGKRSRDIVKVSSEPRMSYGTNRPDNWKSFHPTPDEVAFAQKQWGHLLQGVTSDYEKAKILTKALSRELLGCEGMPSALIYDLPSFEKYTAIRAGKSKFACGQYSEIFSKACNCFGVTNRWGFNQDGLESEDVLIELGSSHLVTEIFDRTLNQWVFLDGVMNALGAYLGDVGPLTLHEVFLFINQPNRRSRLNVLSFDPATGKERLLPVDECSKSFLSYRGWSKGYHTQYQDSLPSSNHP